MGIGPMNGDFVDRPGTILFRENYAMRVPGIDTADSKRLPIAFPLPRRVGSRTFWLSTS
jgi:hypothetical protein